MTERAQNGMIYLTEQGKHTAIEFAKEYGKNNGEGWNMNALFEEIEESVNNTTVGESLQYELGSFESNNGRPNILTLEDADVRYEPIED